MNNILPDDAPRFYYDGDWFQMYDWVEASGGTIDKMEDRFYILFSNRTLKKDDEWNIYSISVSNFGNSLILNEMFDIDHMQTIPNIADIISIYKREPYLQGLDPSHVFFMSNVPNYLTLTGRILNIIHGVENLQPVGYYI